MSHLRRLPLALALLVAVPAAAPAEVTLKLANGTKLVGDAKSYDAANKPLVFSVAGRDRKITLAELDGRSSYLVNRSIVPKDDANAQLGVANFARDVGLFVHASRHYKTALRIDPKLKEAVDAETLVLNRKAAEHCMAKADESLAAGKRHEAEKWLTKLVQRWPDPELREVASERLDELYDEVHGARDDHLEAKAPDLLATDLKKGKGYYDRMVKENEKGLLAKNQNQARRAFKKALSEGQRTLRELDKVAKQRTDPATQETLLGYRVLVNEQIIETRLHYASALMVQSDFQGALRQVNSALAIDRKHKEALAMRSRIEDAASRGIGWW